MYLFDFIIDYIIIFILFYFILFYFILIIFNNILCWDQINHFQTVSCFG